MFSQGFRIQNILLLPEKMNTIHLKNYQQIHLTETNYYRTFQYYHRIKFRRNNLNGKE